MLCNQTRVWRRVLYLIEDYSSVLPLSESKTHWMKSDESILSLHADLIIGTTCRASVYMQFRSTCSQPCLRHSTLHVVPTKWIFVLILGALHPCPYSANHIMYLITTLKLFAFRGKKSHLWLLQCTPVCLPSVRTKQHPKILGQLGWNSKWLTCNKFYQTILILISLQKITSFFS